MTGADNLALARKRLSARKRRAVEEAIAALVRDGHPVTFLAIAQRAGVSRGYLYRKFKTEILSERTAKEREARRIGDKIVPLRTMDEYRHIESLLRGKVDRLEGENKTLRAEMRTLTVAIERERGSTEYWRQQYEAALVRPKSGR